MTFLQLIDQLLPEIRISNNNRGHTKAPSVMSYHSYTGINLK